VSKVPSKMKARHTFNQCTRRRTCYSLCGTKIADMCSRETLCSVDGSGVLVKGCDGIATLLFLYDLYLNSPEATFQIWRHPQ
jgi:hypothetical protein